MSKLSVIIPSRNERFLTQTIEDILVKAHGDIEVIAHIDENPPDKYIDDKRVIYIRADKPRGMRAGINACAKESTGDYLMKCDGHVSFADGFDTVLLSDIEDNWVVIPSRYSLDVETWGIEQNRKPRRDYHYLCFPSRTKDHDMGMHGVEWWERGKERSDPKYNIDDTMSLQGSCWMMKKSWFTNFLGGLREDGYGIMAQEPQEIALKTLLVGGGELKVNKNTFYCHLYKGRRFGRMYRVDQKEIIDGHNWSARHWMNGEEAGMIHSMEWLVEKFWPVPTWPEDRSLWVAP